MNRIACVVAGVVLAVSAISQAAEEFREDVEEAVPARAHDEFEDRPRELSALDKQVDDYNRLINEKRLPEAAAIAKAIQTQYPNHPVAKLLREYTRLLQVLSERGGDSRVLRRTGELVSRVYSVADILAPAPGKDDAETAAEPTEADYQPLMKLIQETVAPLSWDTVNGPASMRPYMTTRSLVVRTTQAAHDEIADLLSQLRRLRGISITLDVQLLTTTTDAAVWSKFGLENPNPVTLSSNQLEDMLHQVPERFRKGARKYEPLVSVPKTTVANGAAARVESPESPQVEALKLKVEALAGTDDRLRLKVSNEETPECAVTVNLKSDESALIDAALLSKTRPTTLADVALRDLFLQKAARTVLIITPTVSYESEEEVKKR